MPNNSLFTTAEIALVLRLYNDIRKGIVPKITVEEHNFLKRTFVPANVYIYNGDDVPSIAYRYWIISSKAPFYNTSRREVYNRGADDDYQLYQKVSSGSQIQCADQLRMLVYDGQPIELLVQCVMIEMGFRLHILPKRTSESSRGNDELLHLAEELQENGTFNI